MDQDQFNDAVKRLASSAQSLADHSQSDLQEAADALAGKMPLPKGCPSKKALAEWCLRNIGQDIDKVTRAFDDLRAAIGFSRLFTAE
jgi:hypothetical protein